MYGRLHLGVGLPSASLLHNGSSTQRLHPPPGKSVHFVGQPISPHCGTLIKVRVMYVATLARGFILADIGPLHRSTCQDQMAVS